MLPYKWVKLQDWMTLNNTVATLKSEVNKLQAEVKTLQNQMTVPIGTVEYTMYFDHRPKTDLRHLVELLMEHCKVQPYYHYATSYISLIKKGK